MNRSGRGELPLLGRETFRMTERVVPFGVAVAEDWPAFVVEGVH
ncbi:MAG: hypothetical protein ACYCSP_15720 [Acidobacteriaceae bacterium]